MQRYTLVVGKRFVMVSHARGFLVSTWDSLRALLLIVTALSGSAKRF